MNTRRRWYSRNNNSFSKNIKDYIIPIIWIFLIIFLIWSLFFKSSWTENILPDNQNGISIEKDTDSTAFISYTNWTKRDVDGELKLHKTEKITVWNWKVKILDDRATFSLNKLWELTYLENWNFSIWSWEVWIDSAFPLNVDMKFVKLKISENSHISLSQNEVLSSIFVVSWMVEISNLVWKNTVLTSGESISISNLEASNEKLDLSIKKEVLPDYFLTSSWFIINSWEKYLKSEEKTEEVDQAEQENNSENKEKESVSNVTWKSKYLTFSNLVDESNVSSSVITVSWVYDTEIVTKIELNWKVAVLNTDSGTFKIEWVSVANASNDLIFKVFNVNEDLKEKFVYTVYNASGKSGNNFSSNADSGQNVFNVDASKFAFTAPTSTGTFTTYESFITIRWNVTAPNIDTVTVNDFKLSTFNWKTWRYHATPDYGTLSDGTNVYEVKYFSGWNLVYKNYFTINKKSWTATSSQVETAVVSEETESVTSVAY